MTLRIALVGAGLVVAASAWALGIGDFLGDAENAAGLLRGLGAPGYVLYIVAFALLEPFGVLGLFFVVPAGMVWPAWLAFGLSLAGATGAGVVGALFARFVARDWVDSRLPARFRHFDERLAERGLQTVIVVRLLFFLSPLAHWAVGLSRVNLRPLVLGTFLGFIPGIALLTLIGSSMLDALQATPGWVWLALGAAAVSLVALRRVADRDPQHRAQ
ncbi:MAG: TVP38/TMEM64 family protein [Myxococcota bacterium]